MLTWSLGTRESPRRWEPSGYAGPRCRRERDLGTINPQADVEAEGGNGACVDGRGREGDRVAAGGLSI